MVVTSHPDLDHEEPPPTAAEVSWALHKLLVASATVDVVLGQQLDLSPSDYQAMKHLMTSTAPLGTVELGALVGLTSGSATGLVDRLERAGHLRRHRDTHDRRRLILEPTAEAIQNASQHLQPLDDQLQALVETYSEQERKIIARFLREATDAYHAYGKPEPHSEANMPDHPRPVSPRGPTRK